MRDALKRRGGPCETVRKMLYDDLVKLNPDKDWSFVTRQIGMFSFTAGEDVLSHIHVSSTCHALAYFGALSLSSTLLTDR